MPARADFQQCDIVAVRAVLLCRLECVSDPIGAFARWAIPVTAVTPAAKDDQQQQIAPLGAAPICDCGSSASTEERGAHRRGAPALTFATSTTGPPHSPPVRSDSAGFPAARANEGSGGSGGKYRGVSGAGPYICGAVRLEPDEVAGGGGSASGDLLRDFGRWPAANASCDSVEGVYLGLPTVRGKRPSEGWYGADNEPVVGPQ
jgi:hypothetical protein